MSNPNLIVLERLGLAHVRNILSLTLVLRQGVVPIATASSSCPSCLARTASLSYP